MGKISIAYKLLKKYVRFMTESVYYDETFVTGTENIPSDGTPVMITSNHQNSLNDALGILLAVNDRKPNFIVRADVFAIHPIVGKFLRSIGLLPAYRMNYEGAAAMKNNASTFTMSEQALIGGETVVIFPEGGHAEGHWLNIFKGGMAKMAFEAAALENFEKDIKIVPACNHYSAYHGLRNKMLVRFGEPVSLQPYYELYKEKPRTASRQLAAEVRSHIEAMMLDVKDKEFYNEIEFVRLGKFGIDFAEANGFDHTDYERRFESDKLLVGRLLEMRKEENKYLRILSSEEGQTAEELAKAQVEAQNEARAADGAEAVPGPVESILLGVREFMARIGELGLEERQFAFRPEIALTVLKSLALVVLFPLAVFCLWPSAVCWLLPKYLADRAKGDMFEGTFVLALNALLILPILGILTLIIVWSKFTFALALIYVLLFPLICLFEWRYVKTLKETIADWRWHKAARKGLTAELEKTRAGLFEKLGAALGRK